MDTYGTGTDSGVRIRNRGFTASDTDTIFNYDNSGENYIRGKVNYINSFTSGLFLNAFGTGTNSTIKMNAEGTGTNSGVQIVNGVGYNTIFNHQNNGSNFINGTTRFSNDIYIQKILDADDSTGSAGAVLMSHGTTGKTKWSTNPLTDYALLASPDFSGTPKINGAYIATTANLAANTDDLTEGSNNLYYTNGRVTNLLSGGTLSDIDITGRYTGADISIGSFINSFSSGNLSIGGANISMLASGSGNIDIGQGSGEVRCFCTKLTTNVDCEVGRNFKIVGALELAQGYGNSGDFLVSQGVSNGVPLAPIWSNPLGNTKVYCHVGIDTAYAVLGAAASGGGLYGTWDNANAITSGQNNVVTAAVPFTAPRAGIYAIHFTTTTKCPYNNLSYNSRSTVRLVRIFTSIGPPSTTTEIIIAQTRQEEIGYPNNQGDGTHDHRAHSMSAIVSLVQGEQIGVKYFTRFATSAINQDNTLTALVVHNVD